MLIAPKGSVSDPAVLPRDLWRYVQGGMASRYVRLRQSAPPDPPTVRLGLLFYPKSESKKTLAKGSFFPLTISCPGITSTPSLTRPSTGAESMVRKS